MSVLRAGRGRGGGGGAGVGGGGGRVEVFSFFSLLIFFFKNVPGLLKRMHNFFCSGGGFWGVWGAPRPHPGVARGRKTIHFFL